MQRELETLAKRSLPFAARELVNGLAFAGRVMWQEEMQASFILRNHWTERNVRVVPARSLRMSRMEAVLAHPEPYMRLLEDGTPQRAARRWRPIPTEIAAGQSKGSLKGGRLKAVRPKALISKLGSLRISGVSRLPRKVKNLRSVQGAIRSGRRLAKLDLGHSKGVYRIDGSKQKPRVWKLYDLSFRVTKVPRNPTLERALERVMHEAPRLAYEALSKQLARVKGAG
jgi:hypothetical protein